MIETPDAFSRTAAAGPLPVVVTITGSGPEDRAELIPSVGDYRPFRELAKHGPPGRVRQGMKDGVEMGLLFNHVVQHSQPKRIVNRLV